MPGLASLTVWCVHVTAKPKNFLPFETERYWCRYTTVITSPISVNKHLTESLKRRRVCLQGQSITAGKAWQRSVRLTAHAVFTVRKQTEKKAGVCVCGMQGVGQV